ncbi:MAG: 23S rRNA (pseudouridine(1915)-N(3))-methyltransferase RlmH [Chlamydiota bacterium]|nr:23S rRNA (pseudouridine(1915)-N(3))-methyltransferase RlmH [Chlamydiota bacterium]
MQKLKIISVGKTKEKWLDDAIEEYLKRLTPILEVSFTYVKDDEQLIKAVSKESNVVCLDVLGKMMSSESFSEFIHKKFLEGGSRLTLVIGGAEGLPSSFRSKYPLISFSLMTFTHQCIRLILIEQIYRAFEIAKGTKYHK